MTLAQLLMEKCYIEQEIARKQADELRKQNSTLNPEAVEVPENAQEAPEQAEEVNRREIIVYNKKGRESAIKGQNRFGSREAKELTQGMWIVTDAYMRGYDYVKVVEKIQTVEETKCFMVINGKRIKKSTWQITYLG